MPKTYIRCSKEHTMRDIHVGDKVRFTHDHVDGSTVSWVAVVVRVDNDGTYLVRHPERARRFPFSPVKTPGLYRYRYRINRGE